VVRGDSGAAMLWAFSFYLRWLTLRSLMMATTR
jgi:hypothetical protein